ncbi:hypothetical protein K7432_018508 [Basidiobolus ranarum]|uniref:Uncharacterized protein n=1 Tax=Basidiobolus ranarum TaxID=34480 RepID=A0ABR2VJR5_9FUNG
MVVDPAVTEEELVAMVLELVVMVVATVVDPVVMAAVLVEMVVVTEVLMTQLITLVLTKCSMSNISHNLHIASHCVINKFVGQISPHVLIQ